MVLARVPSAVRGGRAVAFSTTLRLHHEEYAEWERCRTGRQLTAWSIVSIAGHDRQLADA
jgi:hypothetical protein